MRDNSPMYLKKITGKNVLLVGIIDKTHQKSKKNVPKKDKRVKIKVKQLDPQQ